MPLPIYLNFLSIRGPLFGMIENTEWILATETEIHSKAKVLFGNFQLVILLSLSRFP